MTKIHEELLKHFSAYCENYQKSLVVGGKRRRSKAVYFQRQRDHLRAIKDLLRARAMEVQITRPDKSRSHVTPEKEIKFREFLRKFRLEKFNSEEE